MPSLTLEQQRDLREFVLGFPSERRALIVEWPPGCVVRTKPGVTFLIPAPGVEGQVMSYFENGNLGVVAPMTLPHPEYGWGDGELGQMVKAEIDPADLELVRIGLVLADDVREAMGS